MISRKAAASEGDEVMRFETVTRAIFNAAPEWYPVEKSGEKPFTVRAVTEKERDRIAFCDEIEIENTETGESFVREITFVRDVTDTLPITLHNGSERLIVIQWEA